MTIPAFPEPESMHAAARTLDEVGHEDVAMFLRVHADGVVVRPSAWWLCLLPTDDVTAQPEDTLLYLLRQVLHNYQGVPPEAQLRVLNYLTDRITGNQRAAAMRPLDGRVPA